MALGGNLGQKSASDKRHTGSQVRVRKRNVQKQRRLRRVVNNELCCRVEVRRLLLSRARKRTIVTAVGGVVEGVAGLAVISARGGGCLSHLLLAVALKLVHGGDGDGVAQS